MDKNLLYVAGLALSMFAVSLISGLSPTMFSAKPKINNIVAIIGAGFLLGAALIVLLPEAIHSLYESQNPYSVADGRHIG